MTFDCEVIFLCGHFWCQDNLWILRRNRGEGRWNLDLEKTALEFLKRRKEEDSMSGATRKTARFAEALDEPDNEDGDSGLLKPQSRATSVDLEPFMGVKVRRRSSMYRLYKGDYLDVASNDRVVKLLTKQGDREVLFADKVIKVSRKRSLVRRILLITDAAVYILDAQFYDLKRRISIQSIGKLCLSEQSDNFFAIIVPSEYDTLLASTRKSEIVTVFIEASKKASLNEEELEVQFSDTYEYYLDSEHVREVTTEQIAGGVKTSFVDK